MRDAFKRFVTFSAWLGTMTGLYLGAAALKLERVFWALLAAAALGALLWPRVSKYFRAIRAYERLLNRVATLEQQLENAEGRNSQFVRDQYVALIRGRMEGWRDMRGLIASILADDPPRMMAVSTVDDDVVLIVQHDPKQKIFMGTRFVLQIEDTGEAKGIVEVSFLDEVNATAHLTCVEQFVPEYWARLRDRAILDPSAPPGARLIRYTVEFSSTARLFLSRTETSEERGKRLDGRG